MRGTFIDRLPRSPVGSNFGSNLVCRAPFPSPTPRDVVDCSGRLLSGPTRGAAELVDITHRRDAEEALVLPIEVRGVAVAHAIGRAGRVEVFAQHQAPRLLEAQPLLELP